MKIDRKGIRISVTISPFISIFQYRLEVSFFTLILYTSKLGIKFTSVSYLVFHIYLRVTVLFLHFLFCQEVRKNGNEKSVYLIESL